MTTSEDINPLEREPDYSFITALRSSKEALRIRVKNNYEQHAYVQLLDPNWSKPKVTVDIPIMDDPTIGHLSKYRDFCNSLKGKKIFINGTYIWSPALTQHLDLFTLHIYDSTPAPWNPDAFSNLVIYPARVDPFQMQGDIIWNESKYSLTESSRISLIVPAFSTMILDLYIDKIEPVILDLPL